MSGGLYGRGKAPERACMKLDDWPQEDRRLWTVAIQPADPFADGGGERANYAYRSNEKAVKGYGRYLTYLTCFAPAALEEHARARITKDRVRAYALHLAELGNSTRTILCRLQELGEMARVIDPKADWRFINNVASRIRAKHQPVRDKSGLRLSDETLEFGFELMGKARCAEDREAAILFRDGLIIAFLALVPLRRRNLADLRLGENLIALDARLFVIFEASETKTHAAFEVELPECLIVPMEEYLLRHRPFLMNQSGRWHKPADNFLWISLHGSPMTEIAIYDRIRERTQEKFGTAINPHLFRDAAATTMAITDPAHVRLAAPLLGHRTFSTTEKYYQQAKGYEAHKVYIEAIFGKEMEDDNKR